MKFSGKKINDFMKSLKEKINQNKDSILKEASTTISNAKSDKRKLLRAEALLLAIGTGVFATGQIAKTITGSKTIDDEESAITYVNNSRRNSEPTYGKKAYYYYGKSTYSVSLSELSEDEVLLVVDGKDVSVSTDDVDVLYPYKVNGDFVRLREEPTINSEEILTITTKDGPVYLDPSTTMNNGEDPYTWGKVMMTRAVGIGNIEKLEGYVATEYLSPDNEANVLISIKDDMLYKYLQKKGLKDLGDYTYTIFASKIENGEVLLVVDGKDVKVSVDDLNLFYSWHLNDAANGTLNLRSEPTTMSNTTYVMGPMDSIYVDESTMVNNESYNWAKVMCHAIKSESLLSNNVEIYEGYAATDFLVKDERQQMYMKIKEDALYKYQNGNEVTVNDVNNTPEAVGYDVSVSDDAVVTGAKGACEYAIDISSYSNFEKYKEMVDSGKFSAFIFSIGGTNQSENFYQYILRDDDNEYLKCAGTSESYRLMETQMNEIKDSFNAHKSVSDATYENFIHTGSDDPVTNLEKYVEYATSKGIPVGFYYYSLAINTNEASAEAAYINALYEKLERDVPSFDRQKLLPLGIDIEPQDSLYCSGTRDTSPVERSNAVEELVRLLGHGTSNPDAWTIGNHSPQEGYGIYDKHYVIYEDLNKTFFIDRASIKENLSSEGYECYDWYTRHIQSFVIGGYQNSVDNVLDTDTILTAMNNETDYYSHKDLLAEGEFFQTILDQNVNGLEVDINIAPKGTFEAMSKDKECGKNILEIIEKYKEKNQEEDLDH